jgi:hypothetical protein
MYNLINKADFWYRILHGYKANAVLHISAGEVIIRKGGDAPEISRVITVSGIIDLLVFREVK